MKPGPAREHVEKLIHDHILAVANHLPAKPKRRSSREALGGGRMTTPAGLHAEPDPGPHGEVSDFDVEKVRSDFPILQQKIHGQPLVYLDNAATSQKPRQ